jgi:FKBP12-rapamycin complex-associated protein
LQRETVDILQCYVFATRFDPSSYKVWHTWALANFELVSFLDSQSQADARPDPGVGERVAAHTVQAIQGQYFYLCSHCNTQVTLGFFRSIQIRSENALQDILRLLTLWFKYGAHMDVSHAMTNGFAVVEVDTWLEVIPQVL